ATLKMLLNAASASTPSGSWSCAPTHSDAAARGPRNSIPSTPTIELKRMCASAARRTARLPPIITSADVAVVPMLCPTIMAQPCTNVSEPAFRATSVVAAAAVELCMTIVMTIPMPARTHCEPGPVNPSKFHETPFIPVCMYSIAVKSSPKPARIAPVDRSRPLATIHSRAPMPRMGGAAAANHKRNAETAQNPRRRGGAARAPNEEPARPGNVAPPGADEADARQVGGGGGRNARREDRTRQHGAESPRREPLESAAER